ncbi:MAG TPA: DivIVA domain-containing protein [Mycobacteriales bacterium]|nr:DivIVA domain-containing protein [Mycobacteriales bacterium]
MLVLLEIVLVAAILFAIAAFAVSGVGGMTDAPPERGDDGLPADGLRGKDVDQARFGLAFRGYRMSEVDAVLDRLRDELVSCEQRLAEYTGAAAAEEPGPAPTTSTASPTTPNSSAPPTSSAPAPTSSMPTSSPPAPIAPVAPPAPAMSPRPTDAEARRG